MQISIPVDLVLAIDRSGSMGHDLPETKKAIRELTGQLDTSKDRLGLVSYKCNCLDAIDVPLTFDHGKVLEAIDEMESRGGTNTGAGISVAHGQLKEVRSNAAAVMVVVCDAPGDNGVTAALKAKKENITIYTIGVGTGSSGLVDIATLTETNFQAPVPGQLYTIFEQIGIETSSFTARNVNVFQEFTPVVQSVKVPKGENPVEQNDTLVHWSLGAIPSGVTRTLPVEISATGPNKGCTDGDKTILTKGCAGGVEFIDPQNIEGIEKLPEQKAKL
jgi:hypothetical protein